MKTTKYYKIKGFVYGNYWGGGKGSYRSESYQGDNLDKLMKEIKGDLKTGVLDSGMGYESLIGAILEIETIETIKHNGKEYSNSEFEIEFMGDLTLEEEESLKEVLKINKIMSDENS